MEVETSIRIGGVEDTHQPQRRIQHVGRVGADCGKSAVEVDRHTEHPRRCVGDEVRDVRRRRHALVYPPHDRIVSSVDVVHHGAAVDDAAAFTEHRAAEVARAPHEGRVAERERLRSNNGRAECVEGGDQRC